MTWLPNFSSIRGFNFLQLLSTSSLQKFNSYLGNKKQIKQNDACFNVNIRVIFSVKGPNWLKKFQRIAYMGSLLFFRKNTFSVLRNLLLLLS